jgi:beta-phosphoglucomutase
MIKAFILDFDGVIVDTDPFHFRSWRQAFLNNHIDINFNQEDYNLIKGLGRELALEKIIQLKSISLIKLDLKNKILNNKNDIFLDLVKSINKSNLIPGVEEFILKSKPLYKIAVASASKNASYILEKIGIKDLFDVVVDANITNKKKPDPEVFFKCCDKLNLKPFDCIVFEDSLNGVFASKSGGFLTYGVGNIEIIDYVDFFINNFLDFKWNDINS